MLLLNIQLQASGLSNTLCLLFSGRLQATILKIYILEECSCDSVQADTSYDISTKKKRHEQVKKPFRKNGRNVGMASTSIGRKEVSFIYVDHTINSARGHQPTSSSSWPRAEFMV